MRPLPGTYALIFTAFQKRKLVIGKLGNLHLKPGYYVYVGSAFGPGGLKARIAHHRKKSNRPHWHIDYLGAYLHLNEVWYTYDSTRREHHWSNVLACAPGAAIPRTGFGSSDCHCKSHLHYFSSKPSGTYFRRKIHGSIPGHTRIFSEKFLDKLRISDIH